MSPSILNVIILNNIITRWLIKSIFFKSWCQAFFIAVDVQCYVDLGTHIRYFFLVNIFDSMDLVYTKYHLLYWNYSKGYNKCSLYMMHSPNKYGHLSSVPRTVGRPKIWESKRPNVMAKALTVPKAPLTLRGDTSDVYNGLIVV